MLWSTAFVGIKIGLVHTTPLNFAGTRFFIAGIALLPFSGTPAVLYATVKKHYGYIAVVSLFSTILVYALFYSGISLAPASTTAIVVGGGPLFIAMMAHIFMPNDRLTLRKSTALLIGMIGIWAIAAGRYHSVDGHRSEFWAILLLIGANISGGWANIIVAKSKRSIAPLPLSALQLTLGGATLFLISLPLEGIALSTKPLSYYGALFYLSGVSAGAMTLWFSVLRRPEIKVSTINIWKFIIPLSGAILSWVLLDNDTPDVSQLLGMGAIISALVIIHIRGRSAYDDQIRSTL
jgi:drug/metabolite transporter (DMT)-like permease